MGCKFIDSFSLHTLLFIRSVLHFDPLVSQEVLKGLGGDTNLVAAASSRSVLGVWLSLALRY